MRGRLDEAFCSDFGLHDEVDKRAGKTENVRHQQYIRGMEERIAGFDEARREERRRRRQPSPPRGAVLVATKPDERGREPERVAGLPAEAIELVNRVVAQGLYCSIHGSHHAYDEQAIRNTLASLAAAYAQVSSWEGEDRALAMSRMGDIAAHWLQMHQSEECARKSVWGDVELPDILYKYVPRELSGVGAPNSLRATQLFALNDDMECNVTTMKGSEQEDTLEFLALVQSKLEGHLGVAVPWQELLTRSLSYGDLRLSTFIQEYLNPLVGVVSFSTDILVPTRRLALWLSSSIPLRPGSSSWRRRFWLGTDPTRRAAGLRRSPASVSSPRRRWSRRSEMARSFARAGSSRPGSVSCPDNTRVAARIGWGGYRSAGMAISGAQLVHGARSVLRWRRAKPGTGPGWTDRLMLARRPTNVVLVAMANKTARVAWALLRYERIYRPTPA